jgi:hypothetical protein
LGVVSVSCCVSAQDRLRKQGLSPQSHQTGRVKVFRMQ